MSGPFQRMPPAPTPPLKGSFPLDHDSQCKSEMFEYMRCLNSQRSMGGECKPIAKLYLQCRMDKGLMESDEWSRLGFNEEDIKKADQLKKK
ncbi:unnamed protein product [Bursaphelenchus okinawaensis]|uniref:CHCH domain-containing protein n=1 Tax=Bursaphelenchus okinawaensis TaxID=465554 RepID=A0A811JR02_9BILA|nr:unnamed protein product [Bursaphelenchus okinawaensis]CAG9078157.1 unnamed protein product [Bursaphelenchus okinawaensis]